MCGISLFSHLEPCQHDHSMLVSKMSEIYEFANFMFQLPEGIMQQSHNYLPHLYSDFTLTVEDFFINFLFHN